MISVSSFIFPEFCWIFAVQNMDFNVWYYIFLVIGIGITEEFFKHFDFRYVDLDMNNGL